MTRPWERTTTPSSQAYHLPPAVLRIIHPSKWTVVTTCVEPFYDAEDGSPINFILKISPSQSIMAKGNQLEAHIDGVGYEAERIWNI